MKRPKGPELKMPEVRVPAVLTDLHHDLRDRRLLPVIGLVLVAIVATPFLLGQGGGEAEEAIEVPAAIQALKESGGHRTATLTVVEANPGLRDYRKRLRRRTPLDPFRSFGKPSLKGAQLGGGSGGEGASVSSAPVTSTSTTVEKTQTTETTKTTTTDDKSGGAAPGSTPAPEGGGKGDNPPQAVLYAFGVDVSIVHVSRDADGRKQTSEPDVRKKVLPTVSLPSKDTAVVTYMGVSPKTRKPLFLVSSSVTGVFGEGKCVTGTEACQLIEMEPGFPQTFEYGEGGDLYKIKVTDVELVVTGHS
ncbi:MAG TPA: hypothetical protein VFM94_06360 [Solirubrobacterales bacterium]|nr:hypothetical protein [Solirubrobacterales bacterium]